MSEKWDRAMLHIGWIVGRHSEEPVSESGDYEHVLDHAVDEPDVPPYIGTQINFYPKCQVCGENMLKGEEINGWDVLEGALAELTEDGIAQTLHDGRYACYSRAGGCWKWCQCARCNGEDRIIGADETNCTSGIVPREGT